MSLRIERRYCGPPSSANGGVACGLLAETVAASTVTVTLRRPPPLDVELRVRDGSLYDGDHLVATAVPGSLRVAAQPPVSVEDARAAAPSYAGLVEHPFPGCFVCGTARTDGLGLRPGPIAPGVVAAVWRPASDQPFLLWAALDCPGGWAPDLPGRPLVLGRMSLHRMADPVVGADHVVVGWTLATEGRKTFSGTALYAADGTVLAVAEQTWFAVDPNAF
ncbi:MAG: hypothetical protein NVSMB55_03330 [Mycobacteriales bacterium]